MTDCISGDAFRNQLHMLQTIYRILEKGIGAYPDNEVFRILKALVANVNGVPSLIQCYVAVSQSVDNGHTPEVRSLASDSDHRVKHFSVSSFRGYGGDRRYGVCLVSSDTGSVTSAVLLGNNGTGKTSLFTALEMTAMQHSYIADIYGYSTLYDQKGYLRNRDSDVSDSSVCMTDASENKFGYPDNECELCPKSFFCSQFDIQKYQTEGISRDYILDQLGRLKLLRLFQTFYEFTNFAIQLNDIAKLEKRRKTSKASPKHLALENEIKEKRNKVKGTVGLKNHKHLNISWVNDTLTKKIETVSKFLDGEIERAMTQFEQIATALIPDMINSYLKDDNVTMAVTREGNSIKPVLRRIAGGVRQTVGGDEEIKNEDIEPRIWFNTFRMKLYIVALKMSLAFTVKIIDRLNFPIVLDDVFDASDFGNKYEITNYFRSIVRNHSENTLLNDKPLQIISFTQDRIVADSTYEGIRCFGNTPVKYYRLFDHKECTSEDMEHIDPEYYSVAQLIEN